jgi:hypothetical protein
LTTRRKRKRKPTGNPNNLQCHSFPFRSHQKNILHVFFVTSCLFLAV